MANNSSSRENLATNQTTTPSNNANTNANVNAIARTQSDTTRGTSLTVVGNKFRVGRKIGEGSFGIIYEGILFYFKFKIISINLKKKKLFLFFRC